MGWYQNGLRQGNQIQMDGIDLSIKDSGWYQNTMKKFERKEDDLYLNFEIEDVIISFK